MSNSAVYLNHMALINALGYRHDDVLEKLYSGDTSGMQDYYTKLNNKRFTVGTVALELPLIPESLAKHNTRNNQLALHCLQQLKTQLDDYLNRYPAHRIGVVVGTSTSGIAEGEQALSHHLKQSSFPAQFDYSQIQMSS